MKAELLDAAGARLGEGPSWDARTGRLVWVDILSGRVHLADAEGRPLGLLSLDTHVSAALPAEGGGWLVTTPTGFGRLDEQGGWSPLLDVHADYGILRFNDAKSDPHGRALAGTMRYDLAPGDATLYRLDPGPVAVPLLEGRGLCNGLGWRPDGRLLYFVDSLESAVATYDYDPATGAIASPGEFARFEPLAGMPDGLCVDDDGGVWLAFHGGGTVRRYLPTGELDVIVKLPVRLPTSVAFGGPRGDRLFITTAGGPGHRGTDEAEAGHGGLWAVDPGVSGPPATLWRSPPPSANPLPDPRRDTR